MFRALAASASLLALLATNALADSKKLKGDYGFTGSADCLIAQGHVGDPNVPPSLPNPTPGTALANSGFDANLRVNDIPGSYSRSFSVLGIRTFNGDGTGTVKGTVVGITPRPTPGPGGFPSFRPAAASSDFSFSFTYTVDGDGGWNSVMVPGSFTQNHLTGPRAGQTSTVDAIPPITGMIAHDGKTLIAAHVSPTPETHTYSNGDVIPQICHRSRVFISLPKGKKD